jgi:hypothetical protein
MLTNFHVIRLLTSMVGIITAVSVFASDGQLEINQACAVNTGCFAGDASGFPVTVIQPGSYRLTGSLDLSAEGANVSGISVSAPAVTIDLGGFHITGPTSCSGSGTIISCSPSSTGVGSAGVQFTISATAGVVQNGIVRNMTNFGILSQATGLRVQDITAVHNGRDGIAGREGSLVVNSVAIENGQDGIDINTGSVVDGVTAIGNGRNGINGQGTSSVVTRTSVRHSGMHGFSLGLNYKFGKNNASSANDLANVCGGGICTERRRIYLTQEEHRGDTVLPACTTGFNIAAVSELIDLSNYDYDTKLGKVFQPGTGVPNGTAGWVYANTNSGNANDCENFTSGSLEKEGVVVRVNPITSTDTPIVELFNTGFRTCSNPQSVWCIEATHER